MSREILTIRIDDATKQKLKDKGKRLTKRNKVKDTNNMIEIALEKLSKQSDSDFEQYYL